MVKLSHNRPSLEHGATSQSRVGWQPSGVLAPARATWACQTLLSVERGFLSTTEKIISPSQTPPHSHLSIFSDLFTHVVSPAVQGMKKAESFTTQSHSGHVSLQHARGESQAKIYNRQWHGRHSLSRSLGGGPCTSRQKVLSDLLTLLCSLCLCHYSHLDVVAAPWKGWVIGQSSQP